MMIPLFSVSLPRCSDRDDDSTLLSLQVLGPGDDSSTLLSLQVLGPALLSLLAKVLGPGDDDTAVLGLGDVLCHDVAAHAQCKGEASEHTGFERHGNTDTPELKRRPEWLEKNWHK